MDAGLVREGVGADDRLVRLHREPRNRREQVARLGDLFGDDAGIEGHQVVAHLQRHDDLLQRGISRALADTVDRAFRLTRPGLYVRKSTRLNSSHYCASSMPSSA